MKLLTSVIVGLMSLVAGAPVLAEENPGPWLDPISQFMAVMFIGASLLILLWRTLPQMSKDGAQATKDVAVEMRAAIEKLGADVRAGQDKMTEALLEVTAGCAAHQATHRKDG